MFEQKHLIAVFSVLFVTVYLSSSSSPTEEDVTLVGWEFRRLNLSKIESENHRITHNNFELEECAYACVEQPNINCTHFEFLSNVCHLIDSHNSTSFTIIQSHEDLYKRKTFHGVPFVNFTISYGYGLGGSGNITFNSTVDNCLDDCRQTGFFRAFRYYSNNLCECILQVDEESLVVVDVFGVRPTKCNLDCDNGYLNPFLCYCKCNDGWYGKHCRTSDVCLGELGIEDGSITTIRGLIVEMDSLHFNSSQLSFTILSRHTDSVVLLEIFLPVATNLTAIAFYGEKTVSGDDAMILRYFISYFQDGKQHYVVGEDDEIMFFPGNFHSSKFRFQVLPLPIYTRRLMINGIHWQNEQALRFKLYGCPYFDATTDGSTTSALSESVTSSMPTTTITTTGVDTTTGGSTASALSESVTSSMPTTTIKTTGGSTTSALSESVTSSMPTTTIKKTGGSTTSALSESVTSSMPTTTITTTGVDTTTGGSTASALPESVTSSMHTTTIKTTGVDTTTGGSTTSALSESVTSSMPTTTITTTGVDTTTGGSTTSTLSESVTSSMPTTKITTTGVDTTGGSTTSALPERVTSSMPTTTITTTTGVDTTTGGSTASALPERVTSSMPTTTITTTGVDTTTGGSTASALSESVTSSMPTTTITTTTGVDTTTGGSTASALSESVTSSMPTTTITTTGVDTTTGRSTTSALPERVTSSMPTTTTVESNSGGSLVASVPPLNLSNTNAGEGGDLVSTTIPLYDPTDADVQKIIDRSNQRNDDSGEDSMEEEDNSGEDSMEEEDNSGEDSMEEEEEGQKAKAAPTIPPPRPSIQSLISSKIEDLSSCATALCVNQSVSSVHWAIEQSSGDIDTEILLTYFKFIDTLLNSSLPTTNTLFQVLKKIDSLLNVSNLPVKHSIQEDTNVTSSLLSAVENVAIKYFLLKPNESRINGINEFNVRWVNFASKRGDTKMNFTNKEEIVAELSTTSVLDAYDYMVSIVYEGLHLNQPNKETIGSHIMSVAFANQNGNKLNGGIHLQLKLNLVEDVYTIPTCNFWDVHQSDWSDYGCQVISFNDSWVNCLCNHTTSFAVLMQVSEVSISETNEKVLSMITLIGVSISIICLVLTLLSYIVLKLLHQRNIAIHANLALSLLFAHLIYITGIDATGNKTVCKIIAILLHYFFLASFAWMMIEGAYLYVKSSHAHRKPLTLLHYALIGWVSPLFIVGITAAARYNGYGTPEACWLGLEDGVTWAFVAPVLVVGIINTLIMVRVIKTFNSLKTNADKARTQRMRANLRAILVLQPLLGVTWLFGVLSFNFVWALSFVYLFVICNSLQGAFIFLLHCVMNDEVRKAAFNRLNRFIAIRRGHHGVHPTTNSSSTGTTGLKRTTTSW